MKRPPGAIPPLTKDGLKTIIGRHFTAPVRHGSPSNCWWLKVTGIKFIPVDGGDALLDVESRFKNRPRILLSECVFDEEDPLVASIRRERFLSKLNESESAASRKG